MNFIMSDFAPLDTSVSFKPTELGDLPAEWEVVRLEDVAHLTMGQSPPSSTYNTNGSGMPFLQGKAEFGEVYPTPIKWCTKPLRIAKQNSILISVRAPVGDVNLASANYIIGRGLAAINGDECLNNLYLFYLLTFDKDRIREYETGTTFKSINKGVLQNFLIPLPPLDEQRKIAHVLNTVQQAIAAQDDLIAAAQELKRSLMKRLFTYGPGPEPAPPKETEIGEVPEHWEVVRLDTITEIIMGQSPPGSTYNANGNGVPLINGPAEYGRKHPVPVKWTIQPTKIARPADVLFCVRGNTTGRMNIADREYCIGRGVAAIREIENVSKIDFLYYLLLKEAGKILDFATAGGSTFPNISKSQLNGYQIPAPPLDEQHQIAHILQTADAKIAAEQDRKAALQELFNSLLQELMTGRLRV